MSRGLVLFAAVCCAGALISGCNAATPSAPAAARRPIEAPADVGPPTVAEAVARIARARRLTPVRPVKVEWLEGAALRARFDAVRGESRKPDSEHAPSALGELLESEKREDIERAEGESTVAFYEIERDVVVLPTMRPTQSRAELLGILGHELEHAIVAQRFGPPRSSVGTADAQLALLALHEGDATATMATVIADDEGVPAARAMRQVAEHLAGLGPEQLAGLEHGSRAQRARAHFLYGDGMSFVLDLYRTGGFDLVDTAFRHPPASTAQILEPQRYLDGELPVAVAVPTSRGFRVTETTTLGAHRLGSLMHRCDLHTPDGHPARGWDGDRVSLVVEAASPATTAAPEGPAPTAAGIAVVTAWRSPSDAARFETMAGRLLACLRPGAAPVVERREREVVAVVARLPGQLLDAAFASVGTRPLAEPVAAAVIPRREALPRGGRGTVEDDEYRSPWLGIRMTLPKAVAWSTEGDAAELTMEGSGRFAALAVSDRYATPEQDERALREIQRTIEAKLHQPIYPLRDERVRTALGFVLRRRYLLAHSTKRIVVELLPICRGTGSLVFVAAGADEAAETSLLDAWRSTRPTGPGQPPICARLDPR